jgi:hypothetical protein
MRCSHLLFQTEIINKVRGCPASARDYDDTVCLTGIGGVQKEPQRTARFEVQ